MTNHTNDIKTDDQFLMHDAIEDVRLDGASHEDVPVWIENEDGSGQWSDGWTGEDLPLYTDDDTFFCYEDGDEWLGTDMEIDPESGMWIG